jgi:hypothetical protein
MDQREPENLQLRRNLLGDTTKTADSADRFSSNVGTHSEEHGTACSRHWHINSPCFRQSSMLRYNK